MLAEMLHPVKKCLTVPPTVRIFYIPPIPLTANH